MLSRVSTVLGPWIYIIVFALGLLLGHQVQNLRWRSDVSELKLGYANQIKVLQEAALKAEIDAYQKADSQCQEKLNACGEKQSKDLVGDGISHALTKRVYDTATCTALRANPERRTESNGNYREGQYYCMGAGYLAELIHRGNLCYKSENAAIALGAKEK